MNRNDLPAPNATCEVCGRRYRICKTCSQMRNRGIDSWRLHCDSMECYQILILANTEDISTIDKETFDRATSYELPENRKPIKEIQDKLDIIAKKFEPKMKVAHEEQSDGSTQKAVKPRNKVIEYITSKNVK